MGEVEMTPAEIEREQLSRESHVEEDLNFNSTFSLAEVEATRIRKTRPVLGIEGLMDEDFEEEQQEEEFENPAPVKRSCLGLQEDMPMIPEQNSFCAGDSNGQSPDKSSKELSSSNLDIQGVS